MVRLRLYRNHSHGFEGLRKFNVLVLGEKGSGSRISDCDKVHEIDGELHAYKFDILTAIHDGPINNG